MKARICDTLLKSVFANGPSGECERGKRMRAGPRQEATRSRVGVRLPSATLLLMLLPLSMSCEAERRVSAVREPLCFQKTQPCANWDSALKLARNRAGCGLPDPSRPNRGDRNNPCQQAAECDLCLFLNDDRPPKTKLVDNGDYGGNEADGVKSTMENSLIAHFQHTVEFQQALCDGSTNVELLAVTMIHEADHLCHGITGVWNPDDDGNHTFHTDDCHAYVTEVQCGFPRATSPAAQNCRQSRPRTIQ